MTAARTLVFLCGMLMIAPVNAFRTILDEWRNFYPDSNSDDLECRLCHVNPTGNSPWNAYGITVRNVLEALDALGGGATPANLREAFESAENENLDNDPSGATVIAEILKNYQPGWTEGANNTTTSVNDNGVKTTNTGQPAPVITGASTQLDPATRISNPLPFVTEGNLAVELETIASGFVAPVLAVSANGLPGVLFVVEQTGEIWKVDLSDGSRQLFLDVGPDSDGANLADNGLGLLTLNLGERGLLGLAFHPNYINNGLFYTYQSEPTIDQPLADFSTMPMGDLGDHQSVISEWRVTDPSGDALVSVSRRVVLRIEQPQGNHNGGMLAFGPDQYLYISLGDGGGSDDSGTGHGDNGNGRDNTNPLGSVLRIDPQGGNSANGEYGIPASNPFVAQDGLDEIYAFGFRNPYRFTFDSLCFESGQTCNTLMLGDVGQGEVEEVNRVVAGGNYGWNWKEGSFFFYPPTPSIFNGGRYISLDPPPSLPNNLIDPIAEYRNSQTDGRSVIGGYIYRGSAIPELEGRYVFADFFNRLYYLDANDRIRRFRIGSNINLIGGFGQDDQNELYVVSRSSAGGKLQKLVASDFEEDEEFCVPIIASNGGIAIICL